MTNAINNNGEFNDALKVLLEKFKIQEFVFIAEAPEKYEMHIKVGPDVRLLGMVELAKSYIINEISSITEKRNG